MSYSMPQGEVKTFDSHSAHSSSLDLTDKTYDGVVEDGLLSGGLGQLTDGQIGADNFKMDAKSRNKGMILVIFLVQLNSIVELNIFGSGYLMD